MTTLADVQRRLGVPADGVWGPRTAAAILAAITPVEEGDEITRLATKHLGNEEGRRRAAYRDHLTYLTIGVGRLIDERRGGGLSEAEIDMLLANDIAAVRAALAIDPDTAAAWARVKADPARAVALISMGFQMGVGAPGRDDAGLSGFDTTLGLIAQGMFAAAADAMIGSKWAKQTPSRAMRVAAMIRTGKIA